MNCMNNIKQEKISVKAREEYYRRLTTPYVETKTGKPRLFIEQFLSGSGNELINKFWKINSSSRLCFDLYSWMADDQSFGATNIEFEKKLPGIISGGRQISSNMDVFYETQDSIVFIESKFTETANNKNYRNTVPEAYWKEEDEYHNNKGKLIRQPILERYSGNVEVKNAFVSFYNNIKKEADKKGDTSWFDAKQETCHLLGIVSFLIKENPNKNVYFFNVAANYTKNEFACCFCDVANKTVHDLLNDCAINVNFNYELCSVKDYFNKNGFTGKKAYKSDKSIVDLLADTGLYVSNPFE